jgi:hypothetical protein
VCSLAREMSKYATYSGPDASLLVLQHVSIADDSVMVFATGTIVEGPYVHDFAFVSQ